MSGESNSSKGVFGGIRSALSEPAPVHAAVYMRVVLAIWTMLFVVPRLPYLKELYTPSPIMEPSALMTLIGVPVLPIWFVGLMHVVLMFAAFGFALGYYMRPLHLLILVIFFYLFGLDRWAIRGFGELAFYQWIWLFFLPYDKLWDEQGRVVKAPMWGQYLLWGQLTVVYLSTFYGKWTAHDHIWQSGIAMYNATHNHGYGVVFLTEWIDVPAPVARVLSWLVLGGELAIPLMIWNRRTRPLALVGIICIHLGAAVTMRVTVFFQLLLLAHAPLLLSTRAWEKAFFKLGLTTESGERRRPLGA